MLFKVGDLNTEHLEEFAEIIPAEAGPPALRLHTRPPSPPGR
jgi:hypothetical protein